MGVDVFCVNLLEPFRQYFPGEIISGNVFVRISGRETTTEILLNFFGYADTNWTESETRQVHHSNHSNHNNSSGSHTETETVHHSYSAHETLFELTLRLFGDASNRVEIPPGDHLFPFEFQIPLKPLPVSCSFDNGKIVYGLKARMRKPWYRFDPKTVVLPVTILTMIDLNLTIGAHNPMTVEDSKTFGCCCCPSKPCFLRTYTPKLGYLPGEDIPLTIEVENHSGQDIFNLTATLTQTWTMHADGHRGRHTRSHPVALTAIARGNNVRSAEMTDKWVTSLRIPPTVPPSQSPMACGIIKMEYLINISAASDGMCCCDDKFALVHPIIIGNVPRN